MTRHTCRLNRLEEHYRGPFHDHPARIPGWLRPWLDPLTDEDLEVLEAGGFPEGADGDPSDLSPEGRERFHELKRSWERFCAGLDRGA